MRINASLKRKQSFLVAAFAFVVLLWVATPALLRSEPCYVSLQHCHGSSQT